MSTSTTRAPSHSPAWPSSAPHNRQWHPMAHVATSPSLASPPWLLDSSASHHVTSDLNNLNLHAPYDGPNDVVIGDGTGLHITHSDSTSLPIPSRSFALQNVLCVPNMKQNLISISQFCKTNKALVEFLPSSFHVKDLQKGQYLFTVTLKIALMNGQPSLSHPSLRSPVSKSLLLIGIIGKAILPSPFFYL